jgi:hypothetical protein
MRLKTNQLCMIHNRRDCCGRRQTKSIQLSSGGGPAKRKYASFEPGVTLIPDEHHPRGYRERRSPAAMRRVLERKVKTQGKRCGICSLPFTDSREIVPDHIVPKGSGGAWHDDHPDNIQAAHSDCNMKKGSRRNFTIQPQGVTA